MCHFQLKRAPVVVEKLATAARRDNGGILSDPGPMKGDDNLEAMAAVLEASGRYRVLRRLEITPFNSGAERTRCGIFLDVETTGLDHRQHEIIELALVPFSYTHDGDITAIGEPLTRLQQPSRPIPQEITAITGLTDADVAGHVIDPAEIAAIIAPAAIILAHNAAFDRPFVERAWPTFSVKPWGCSMAEVPWTEEGFDGLKLGYLAMAHGVFFDAHRAANDCLAALHILRRPLPSGTTGLARLLKAARAPSWRIWAENAPYDVKDKLKARNYRWSDGSDGRPRSWWTEVEDHQLEAELAHLRSEIYGAEVDLRPIRMTAFERYSKR